MKTIKSRYYISSLFAYVILSLMLLISANLSSALDGYGTVLLLGGFFFSFAPFITIQAFYFLPKMKSHLEVLFPPIIFLGIIIYLSVSSNFVDITLPGSCFITSLISSLRLRHKLLQM